eukprot:gene6477-2470_t
MSSTATPRPGDDAGDVAGFAISVEVSSMVQKSRLNQCGDTHAMLYTRFVLRVMTNSDSCSPTQCDAMQQMPVSSYQKRNYILSRRRLRLQAHCFWIFIGNIYLDPIQYKCDLCSLACSRDSKLYSHDPVTCHTSSLLSNCIAAPTTPPPVRRPEQLVHADVSQLGA